MELAYITIRFDSPKEQKFVERHVDLSVWEHETHKEGSRCSSWTDFDISGCEPSDVHEILDEVMEMWENRKYDYDENEEEDEEDDEDEELSDREMPWDYGKHFDGDEE